MYVHRRQREYQMSSGSSCGFLVDGLWKETMDRIFPNGSWFTRGPRARREQRAHDIATGANKSQALVRLPHSDKW